LGRMLGGANITSQIRGSAREMLAVRQAGRHVVAKAKRETNAKGESESAAAQPPTPRTRRARRQDT
jgi:hypothetical protein